jgi:hypothetical protein
MSIATGRSCPCGGSNSNCCHCFGTGVIESKQGGRKALGTGAGSKSAGNATRPLNAPSFVLPPVGSGRATVFAVGNSVPSPRGKRRTKLRFKKLRQKSRQTAPAKLATPKPQPAQAFSHLLGDTLGVVVARAARSDQQLLPFSHCNARVKPTRLRGHLQRVHGVLVASAAAGPQSSTPPHKLSAASSQAPRQGAGRDNAGASGARRRRTIPSEVPAADSSHPVEEQQRERRLDASRDYAGIREGGRFGSHPAHDDHGDDSAP